MNVRDIGGFEEARAMLQREEEDRRDRAGGESEESRRQNRTKEAEGRTKAFDALLLGLKECE